MELWRTEISYIQWKRRTTNWIGHVAHKNCLLKGVIERKVQGRIHVKRRRRRKRKQLPDDVKETRRYCKLKQEALDRNLRKICFGREYGHFVRQAMEGTGG